MACNTILVSGMHITIGYFIDCEVITTVSLVNLYRHTITVLFLVMTTFKTYAFIYFQMYNTVLLTIESFWKCFILTEHQQVLMRRNVCVHQGRQIMAHRLNPTITCFHKWSFIGPQPHPFIYILSLPLSCCRGRVE